MTVLEILAAWLVKAGKSIPDLDQKIKDLIARHPDANAVLGPLAEALEQPVNFSGSAAVGVGELLLILQGKTDGRDHPSDAF